MLFTAEEDSFIEEAARLCTEANLQGKLLLVEAVLQNENLSDLCKQLVVFLGFYSIRNNRTVQQQYINSYGGFLVLRVQAWQPATQLLADELLAKYKLK